ncbi:MAG TPA: hypothetical protein PLY97_06975 [Acidocella sp.]|nr:hypothetical protein [Acidocella sp.]
MFGYHKDDYDIAAFVCLSLGQMFFRAAPVHRASVRTEWLRAPGIACESFVLALQNLQRHRYIEDIAWLASLPPELSPPTPAASAMPAAQPMCNL